MYSRTPHEPPRAAAPDGRTGEPGYRRTRPVILPPNYGGSAFSAPPAPEPDGAGLHRDRPEPRFDGLPRVTPPPEPILSPEKEAGTPAPPDGGPPACSDPHPSDAPAEGGEAPAPSGPSASAPSSAPPRLPFSLGIGYEEMLLLGLILLILNESAGEGMPPADGSDTAETVLLLGALLLLG